MNSRDYSVIADRVFALSERSDSDISIIGSLEDLPVYRLVRQSSSTRTRRLLLTSGVHGDEPAGEQSEDSEPVSPGVLCVQPSWGQQGLLTYVLAYHTDHAVMFETPSGVEIEIRIATQLAAFDTVLNYLS